MALGKKGQPNAVTYEEIQQWTGMSEKQAILYLEGYKLKVTKKDGTSLIEEKDSRLRHNFIGKPTIPDSHPEYVHHIMQRHDYLETAFQERQDRLEAKLEELLGILGGRSPLAPDSSALVPMSPS